MDEDTIQTATWIAKRSGRRWNVYTYPRMSLGLGYDGEHEGSKQDLDNLIEVLTKVRARIQRANESG